MGTGESRGQAESVRGRQVKEGASHYYSGYVVSQFAGTSKNLSMNDQLLYTPKKYFLIFIRSQIIVKSLYFKS